MKKDMKDRSKPRKRKYHSLKQAVEPRYLYDASLVAPPHDPGITADAPSSEATNTAPPDASTIEQVTSAPAEKTPVAENETLKDPEIENQLPGDNNVDTTLEMQEFMSFIPEGKELVFIDARLNDPQIFLNGLPANAEIHFIDGEADTINQIDQIIRSHSADIRSIHRVS